MVHVKAHSAFTKKKKQNKTNPSSLDFCYPDVLKTWQQSTPKLGN